MEKAMITERIRLTHTPADEEAYRKAGEIIKNGGLVAFPTETVYGLGGDAFSAESSRKIYAAKGRPSDNPLIIHIAEKKDVRALTPVSAETAGLLADAFWPGPLTMILPKREEVPYETTGGLDTVAIRMPDHAAALSFIRHAGGFIAAPSANRSGRPSPTNASHVWEDLSGRIELILDDGETEVGLESTIVDLCGPVPVILRPGFITQKDLSEVIGEVSLDPGFAGNAKERPKAPGMKYRHYAPRAEMILVKGTTDAVVSAINRLASEEEEKGIRVGILSSEETKESYTCGTVLSVGFRKHEEEVARSLYAVLRRFDEIGVQKIYSEDFSGSGLSYAIENRMKKAAGNKELIV